MDNLKSYISESVRDAIKRQIAASGDEFVTEMASAFSSYPLMEAAAKKECTTEKMINPSIQLRQDLEDQGLDDDDAGVAANIRQLQTQMRGLN